MRTGSGRIEEDDGGMNTTSASKPTSSTTYADDDPRAVFGRAVALTGTAIDGVEPSQLHDPTPCGMDVRELQEHLVMVLRRVACAGRGQSPWEWPIDAADVDDNGFADAWQAAAADVDAAWADDALLERPTELPWGTFSGAEVQGVYTNELTVHTWDLAKGTGQAPAWDDAVVAVSDAVIHAQLPMADRAPMWEAAKATLPSGVEWTGDPFGPAVDVPDDAPAIDRLVAWNGRDPS
jgi:uncharacterized protein (TIGR03086 family)